MKRQALFAATTIALAFATLNITTIYAQEKPAAKPAPGMPMDRDMQPMMDNMKKMQEEMRRIRETADRTERQKLMQEHMKNMQQGMTMMRGMGGPMMMGMTGAEKGGPRGMGPDQRMNMMERRMDMMQMMMEQMMQREQMQTPPPR